MIIRINNYVPRPKQRPRFSKKTGKVYSPSSSSEKSIANVIRLAAGGNHFDSDIFVGLKIVTRTRLRGDIDNYEKFVYDALQKSGVIRNDSQIRSKKTDLYYGSDCLIIEIRDLFDSLSDQEKIHILHRQGHSVRHIADKVNVSKTHVHRLIQKTSHKWDRRN